jgi:hypothetical protein
MIVLGRVRGGTIILEEETILPEGATVRVEVLPASPPDSSESGEATLYERMKLVAGVAKGLPADLAANHDHYLHGRPKP